MLDETETSHRLILLPGMDGTGDLFDPLLKMIPPKYQVQAIAYPADELLSYEGLYDFVGDQLRNQGQIILVAESFSGPLALRIANSEPERIRAVILCASFVYPPVPRWVCGLNQDDRRTAPAAPGGAGIGVA